MDNVTFEQDIPSITREGAGRRSSKYNDLLDKLRERAESGAEAAVAVLSFDKASLATSRYTSIRDAAQKRPDALHWTVVTRTFAEDDVRVYVKWNDEEQEPKVRKTTAKKTETAEPEVKKAPAKKAAAKKTTRKTTRKTAARK